MKLSEYLAGKSPILLDGAMGTQLAEAGLDMGGQVNLSHPQQVQDIHRRYAAAGSHMLITNTLTMNRIYIETHRMELNVREVNLAGAHLTRAAAQEGQYVLGDMSSTGQMLEPYGSCKETDVFAAFSEQAQLLIEGGVDGFVVETVFDLREALIALKACREAAAIPVIVCIAFQTADSEGRTIMGNSAAECAAALADAGADAVGANCGEVAPSAMAAIVGHMREATSLPIIAQPNAGVPRLVEGRTTFSMGPVEFADGIDECLGAGAGLVGGCCGTAPEHISQVSRRIGKPN